MAHIIPIRGFRPSPETAPEVCAPPYDVLSSDEAREYAKEHPNSFLRVTKPEIDLPPDTDQYADEVYSKGAENIRKMIDEGFLKQDDEPCLYIYRLKTAYGVQTGILCGVAIDDYDTGMVKKHEQTRRIKEEDRSRHIEAQHGNAGPVLMTYRRHDSISKTVSEYTDTNEPEISFTDVDGTLHTFWVLRDSRACSSISACFDEVGPVYIADGHHRAAATSNVRAQHRDSGRDPLPTHFLAALFPDNELTVLEYNRLVKDLDNYTEDTFLEKLKEGFDIIEGGPKPEKPKHFGLLLKDTWRILKVKENTYPADDPVGSLDVSILQENVLGPILNIRDINNNERIRYKGGTRGIEELEEHVRNECKAAFTMYPTTVAEIMAVADAGEIMPPKSTWFFPKLYSGFVFYSFD